MTQAGLREQISVFFLELLGKTHTHMCMQTPTHTHFFFVLFSAELEIEGYKLELPVLNCPTTNLGMTITEKLKLYDIARALLLWTY
jgi:hypothetical protein